MRMFPGDFTSNLKEADYPDEKDRLTEALQVLGRERNSLSIRTFLSGQSIYSLFITNSKMRVKLPSAH